MITPANATAAFNTIDRLFKLITWTAVTGVVFIAYRKSGDWPELLLLVVMGAMIVVATLSIAVIAIGHLANGTPRGTRSTRLAFYAIALAVMAALAFGLTSAIHTLVLKL